MKYSILTFGCRVNQADSFQFEESLRAAGGVAAGPEDADLVVVNTCTVTRAADQGARNLIRRIARDNATARIVVTGCYATREPDDLAALPQVVRVVPNAGKDQFAAELRGEAGGAGSWERFGDGAGDGPCGSTVEPGVMGRTAYPLRVQTGCDEACTFCIIPSTRGASRSRLWADIRADVERLSAAGYKELWLVGVHLGSYGRDLDERSSLTALLRQLDACPGEAAYRISSLEPMDCSRELVDLVAASGRFAPHFHLPLQHGCDALLGLMRRPYTVAGYVDIVSHIRAVLPHASIGADMVAGFPGERDEDADASAMVVDALPLSYLHVFPYSDRPGTAASAMYPKVAPPDARRRAETLRAIGARKAESFALAQVGSVRPGLTIDDGATVLTDNFLKVRIPPGLPRNARVSVRIEAADRASVVASA